MNLDNLNEKQKEAVLHGSGPCLVIAGAGSGKTKVLTTRIANLINEGVYSSDILAITFTNKAAKEMRDRLHLIIGDNYSFVGTFHSFGVKIIRENYELCGLTRNFTIIDSDDQSSIIKKIMKELLIDPKELSVNSVKNKISFIKNEMLNESMIDKYLTGYMEDKIKEIYIRYVKILDRNNAIDFDDLLKKPVELFTNYPLVLDRYQDKFKYILIDEYQDTNEVQYKLVKLLSKKYNNIFVVGDVNQSIYSFRWSNYKNILKFEKDFKDTKVITLSQNYRSTTTILNAANDVIKNNIERKDLELYSNLGKGSLIEYQRCINDTSENKNVVDKIKKLLDEGYKRSDIAVFYRTNAQSRGIEEAMIKGNVPYKVIGSFLFYKRKEIKDLISYLKLISNTSDDISLERVINTPKRGIGITTVSNLIYNATINNMSAFDYINSGKELLFKNMILDLKNKQDELDLTEFIDLVLDKSGLIDELKNEKTLEADLRIDNLMEFRSITESYTKETGSNSLDDFLETISLVSDSTEYKDDNELVTLMTIHAAKGLEFRVVFIIGMEEGILPHANSLIKSDELEEERRLCYVAITRAKEKLFISNSERRMLYGRVDSHLPSRFIGEINDSLLSKNSEGVKIFHKEVPRVTASSEMQEFSNGEIVLHSLFGKGVVVNVDERFVTIAFDKRYGIKKVLKSFKGLQKR